MRLTGADQISAPVTYPQVADNGLSFLGVVFEEAIVFRVEVRYGTGSLGPDDGAGGVDVAVMDNFIFGEPQAIP